MGALLGRKLGMTQVFDTEDGHVERVTVVEAGPCFVTAIRRKERDGYDAVQLGFGEATEKSLTKGQLGHLKVADAPPLRRLAEFRDEAGELEVGSRLKVGDVFEKGQTVKVSGHLEGQGLSGHDQATQLLTRPRLARLAQRARARLDRAVRHAVAGVQGDEGARSDGQRACYPEGPRGRGRPRGREPPLPARLGARARRARSSRSGPIGGTPSMAAPQASYLGKKSGKVSLKRPSSASPSTSRSCTAR